MATESAAPATPTRRRTTKTSVLVADRVASVVIRVGGMGVVAAVLAILGFLVVVTFPLFRGARMGVERRAPLLSATEAGGIADIQVDELALVGIALLRDGRSIAFSVEDGRRLAESRAFEKTATSIRRAPGSESVAVGFADGTIRTGRAGFATTFLSAADAPPAAASLRPGHVLAEPGGSVLERLESGDLRRVVAEVRFETALPAASPASVALLDLRVVGEEKRLAVLHADGRLFLHQVTMSTDFNTGESKPEATSTELPSVRMTGLPSVKPTALVVTSSADRIIVGFSDGTVVELDPSSGTRRYEAKVGESTPTALALATGEQTLVVGDASGNLSGWFRIQDTKADGAFRLVRAHTLERSASPIRKLDFSQRSRIFVAASEDGSVAVHHLTSERRLASFRAGSGVAAIALSPKADRIVTIAADGSLGSTRLDAPHPEASFRSLFGHVWYEGYEAPTHTWQSSAGSDDFEPKLSLVPLIFGTFKATLYALLFAVPIALFAAIYTSEFLVERLRGSVKPAIEAMASLPSVILGFLAALVLSPIVERNVLAVLTGLTLVPVAALLAGHLLPLLPLSPGSTLRRRIELPVLILVAVATFFAGRPIAGRLEARLFGGDFSGWLDGRHGEAAPGLAVLSWPVLVGALLVTDALFLAPRIRRRLRNLPRSLGAVSELARFAALLVVSSGLAPVVGSALAGIGLDARAGFLGTYVQRNALLVGFAMGFAVIPIVYTVAEDALTAVPRSLRSASIGCGATRWQTATRIVLPVAVPGIFSAVMVGFGRAVGETMIVVMAAGNTPILDWNPFNGLRSLSATIAVEMPEAARGGTLYRTLFLAALVLFALTFLVNTLAELVRQRFRKKALAL